MEPIRGTVFDRGFVQHVLPRGLQKVGHYGWMSPNSKLHLDEVRWLVWLFLGWIYSLASGHAGRTRAAPAADLWGLVLVSVNRFR